MLAGLSSLCSIYKVILIKANISKNQISTSITKTIFLGWLSVHMPQTNTTQLLGKDLSTKIQYFKRLFKQA